MTALKGTQSVWVASTWPARPVFHATDRNREDREVTFGEHTGPIAGWNFTRCGIFMLYSAIWEDDRQRFYGSEPRGIWVPLRILNWPAVARPCRRCWP